VCVCVCVCVLLCMYKRTCYVSLYVCVYSKRLFVRMHVRVCECARAPLSRFSYVKHVVLIACQACNIRVCLTFCKTIFPNRFIFCTVALNTNMQFQVRRSCVGSQNISAIEKTLIVFASCVLCVPHVLNRWKCRRYECL